MRKINVLPQTAIALVMTLVFAAYSFSQGHPQFTVPADANACELNGRYIDELATELANNPNMNLRIVFAPGSDEAEATNSKRQTFFRNALSEANRIDPYRL